MTQRDRTSAGAPCWVELFTPDVDAARRFYGGLFGWEANEPSAEFGGYFMFLRDGEPVAGGMGPYPGAEDAVHAWNVYLATDDAAALADRATGAGAQVAVGPMPVADLGVSLFLVDPSGAGVGAWQAGSFPGFTTVEEPGAPSWFELHTREGEGAVDFYCSVFGLVAGDGLEDGPMTYTTVHEKGGDTDRAGIMEAAAWLPPGVSPSWSVYWAVADVRASAERVTALGGSVVAAAQDTPYGTMATVADPSGVVFKLRTPPA